MKKFALTSLLVAVCALGFGQANPINLGVAKPIDIHVTSVEWHPSGDALIYHRTEEKGVGLGVYSAASFEGKVILHLRKDENEATYWLAKSKSAVLVIHSPVLDAKTKSTQIRIYLLNAENQTAKVLFKDTYDNKLIPSVDVDTSPSLEHAIVTLRNSTGSHHLVLVQGGGTLMDSPDLDRAEKEGLSGPNWSLDGTAIYSKGGSGGIRTFRSDNGEITFVQGLATAGDTGSNSGSNAEVFSISLSSLDVTSVKSTNSSQSLRIRFMPPMPPTGSTVYELMPSNAILRPIRFRGPWVWSKNPAATLVPQNQSLTIHFDQSNAQDTSVWLTRGTQKGAPAALVAVHVTDTWLPDTKNAVAFTIDGALFFRSIGN